MMIKVIPLWMSYNHHFECVIPKMSSNIWQTLCLAVSVYLKLSGSGVCNLDKPLQRLHLNILCKCLSTLLFMNSCVIKRMNNIRNVSRLSVCVCVGSR